MMKKLNIPFKAVCTGKLRRYFSLENLLDLFRIPIGFLQSLLFLHRFKPDLVFSKGGYVSVPVVFAAFCLRIRVVLHESDISPGLANRICSRFASEILLSSKLSERFFPKKPTQLTGIPIRHSILSGSKSEALEFLGFNQEKPVLLIMGGSSGARAINEVIDFCLDELLNDFQVVHISGQQEFKRQKKNGYRTFAYLNEELADVYALADIVISRAGANSLAELAALAKKVILIPLPKLASRGDQIENAEDFVENYGGEVLYQENLNAETLLQAVKKASKSQNSHSSQSSLHKEEAAARILDVLRGTA